MATLYYTQGRYGEAEPLYLCVLKAREQILGQDHLDTLISVNNLAGLYYKQDRYDEAEPLLVRVLETRERILGQNHPDTLLSLNSLAVLYRAQGRYGEAEPLYGRALDTFERILGQDHPYTLVSVNNFANLYRAQGRYSEAESLLARALDARKRILGWDHPHTLQSVNNLAFLYQAQGRYGEAEPLLVRALEGRKRILGRDHSDTLESVNNLAVLYQVQGRYGEAEPLFVRALEASKRILGRDHPHTLISLNNLAELYQDQGRYGEAEPLYLRALEACERILGQDHPQTLASLNNLAGLYQTRGRYGEAEPLYLRALETSERILGQDHPQTLASLNNLAGLYQTRGRYGEAEPLYLRALEANERVLGKDHPQTLNSVNSLATLYGDQGRHGEVESLYLRALEARERILGRDHPDTLVSVNNLALLYHEQGRYGEAEMLYLRALEASERTLGQDHPYTLGSVNNLAGLYDSQGRYDEAEPLYARVLEAHERTLGQDHPQTLTSVNNLAGLYDAQGRYNEAELLLVRAVEAYKGVLGEDHPRTLVTQLNLAGVLINRGQRDRAVRELRRMDGRLRRFIGIQLATTHREQIRRRWLVTESRFQNVVFSLALQHPDSDALRLAADVLLCWKRLAGEAEALTARLVRSSHDPQVVKLAKELSSRRSELSRLVNLPEPDEEAAATARKNATAAARSEVERLEVELAGMSREFQGHLASRTVGWEQVRSELPRGSALLSLRAFSPWDFTTEDVGEPHWLGLLIPADPGDGPELLLRDLGPIGSMSLPYLILRETGAHGAARRLYQLLFGKLDAELTKYDRLYIAPDGALDLVPSTRLVVPDGRYWIERQELRQIRTGRDLVQESPGRSATGGMLVLGGVDYTNFPAPEEKSPPPIKTQEKTTNQLLAMNLNRRLRDERKGFMDLKFTDLEAKLVGQLYWDPDGPKAQVWRGRDASETRLKSRLESLASPPRILHLATHGFFFERKSEHTERPMTLAGLALAGANAGMQGKRSPAGEDGVLYALETQDLNLEGTELVTLSACDTGRGEVDYSEGVYGLVRAFRIAGARNLLMTLWPLNDRLAADFMRDFYAAWFKDPLRHPAEVLRETQLAWIRDKDSRRSDPSHWASYVLIEGR